MLDRDENRKCGPIVGSSKLPDKFDRWIGAIIAHFRSEVYGSGRLTSFQVSELELDAKVLRNPSENSLLIFIE